MMNNNKVRYVVRNGEIVEVVIWYRKNILIERNI